MNGMPPHIAQLVVGHRDINTTMGYKAVCPEELISGHRAFIARRRASRPSEECRTPTDEEREEFLGRFERRRVALGDCGRACGTSCVRAQLPQMQPATARSRPAAGVSSRSAPTCSTGSPKPRGGLTGEVEGLKASLVGAEDDLARIDRRSHSRTTVGLGMPMTRSEDH